jgi:hypothetical protein
VIKIAYFQKKSMNKALSLLLIMYISTSQAVTPLLPQEKLDFIKSGMAACISKNSMGRLLSSDERGGLQNYCSCHASVMASYTTREDLSQISKGRLPGTFHVKVSQARDECVRSLLNK